MWSFFFSKWSYWFLGEFSLDKPYLLSCIRVQFLWQFFLLIDVDLFLDDYIICQIYLQLLEFCCNFMLFWHVVII